jgi:hypothetical protein
MTRLRRVATGATSTLAGASVAVAVFGLIAIGPGLYFILLHYIKFPGQSLDDTPIWAVLIASPMTVPLGIAIGLWLGVAIGLRVFKRNAAQGTFIRSLNGSAGSQRSQHL